MSVILKALEKAERERSHGNGESATVLSLPPVAPPAPPKVIVHRPRYGLIIASVLTSTIVTIVLVAGVLWFVQLRMRDWTQATHTVAPPMPAVAANPGGVAPAVAIPAVSASAPPSAFVAADAATPSSAIAAPAHTVAGLTATPVADLPTPVPMSELLRQGPMIFDESAAAAAAAAAVTRAPEAVSASKARAETDSSEQSGFVLGPILYDPRSPMAIVNGLSVRQGGVYENFRVLSITPDSVTVQRAGEPPVTLRKR